MKIVHYRLFGVMTSVRFLCNFNLRAAHYVDDAERCWGGRCLSATTSFYAPEFTPLAKARRFGVLRNRKGDLGRPCLIS